MVWNESYNEGKKEYLRAVLLYLHESHLWPLDPEKASSREPGSCLSFPLARGKMTTIRRATRKNFASTVTHLGFHDETASY